MTERNFALATTLPDTERVSGKFRRATSTKLEIMAQNARELAAQIATGKITPRVAAEKIEMFARTIDVCVGETLTMEARK